MKKFYILAIAALIINILFALLLFVFTDDSEFFFDNTKEAEKKGFSRFLTLLYFSITTFTTVGYGDIAPQSLRARALVGTFQVLVFAGLVSVLFNITS
jgi:amino acid transporter